jgi:hypothetical protein
LKDRASSKASPENEINPNTSFSGDLIKSSEDRTDSPAPHPSLPPLGTGDLYSFPASHPLPKREGVYIRTRSPGAMGTESPSVQEKTTEQINGVGSVDSALVRNSIENLQADKSTDYTAYQPSTDLVPAAILDIPTPQSGHLVLHEGRSPTPQSGQIKNTLSRVSRRLYSRTLLGVKLPGRYYFITWTSSPQSPPIEKSWFALKKWLKRKRPGACWCYCFTDEGHGVIHMVMRLGRGEKRLDVNEVRAHWQRLHKATQIRIDHIPESGKNNLSAYIADQRAKRRLGGEMAWQDDLIRWRWSKGWLPKGFTRAFGRLWYSLKDVAPGLREKVVGDWLHACHVDGERVQYPPTCNENKGIEYHPVPVRTVCPGVLDARISDWLQTSEQVLFDKNLERAVRTLVVDDSPGEPDDWIPEGRVTLAQWEVKYKAYNQKLEAENENR